MPGYIDLTANSTGKQTSIMGTWNFGYDTLNRLSTAAAANAPAPYAGNYGCWNYDVFGNRTSQSMSTTPCGSNPALTSWAQYNGTINGTNNNQMSATNQNLNQANGYDPAGNIINDGTNQYLYDGAGRICAVASTPVLSMTTMTGYLYDASGTRVAKGSITAWSCDPVLSGFKTINDYVLGPNGEQVTEMGVNTTAGSGASTLAWQHSNVYAGSTLIATYDADGLHFYLNDPLGTRRVQTDYAGIVEQSCTGLPYGDGLTCTGSTINPTEQHFTGKERDTESENDYFGARYYASSMGRMMSPDPSQLVYADQMNPQSLNLYSYVLNNPLINTDPTGMECVWDDGSYDSNDDPDTGSKKQCEGGNMGGHWADHSFFQNANDNGANLPDWSPDANSSASPTTPLGLVNLVSTCTDTILGAINSQPEFAQTGLDMTTDNVTGNFWYHGAVNIDISATNLSSAQYNAIHSDRYKNPDGKETSPSLHLPKGPGGSDSPQTLPFSNPKNGTISTTAHIDSALAGFFHPAGTAIHLSTDVRDSGAHRTPCPQ